MQNTKLRTDRQSIYRHIRVCVVKVDEVLVMRMLSIHNYDDGVEEATVKLSAVGFHPHV